MDIGGHFMAFEKFQADSSCWARVSIMPHVFHIPTLVVFCAYVSYLMWIGLV